MSVSPQRWDLFCRIVDNLGDAAVMWRLARQLAVEHGFRIRLFVDDPTVLARLVPGAEPDHTSDGVEICRLLDDAFLAPAADVAIAGFHAEVPASYRLAMSPGRPVWINLEYLSAEPWVDECHGLPSPRPEGLTQHYFYPGFTPRTGGLLREADLFRRRDTFRSDPEEASHWLAGLGVAHQPGETMASLLCYPNAPLEVLASQLADAGVRLHLVVPDGAADAALVARALAFAKDGAMRVTRVPFLAQYEYDRLLWACDLNFVRGEDSWVRAIWSGKPFVWQIYQQEGAAHLRKLEAFLHRLTAPASAIAPEAALMANASRAWNRASDNEVPGNGVPAAAARAPVNLTDLVELIGLARQPVRAAACLTRLADLSTGPDLTTRLIRFAAGVPRHTGDGQLYSQALQDQGSTR